jgi:hypothetical protein
MAKRFETAKTQSGHRARADKWVWYDSLMDGVHDMGGMDGFGKIEAEKNEPVFHAEWEGRVLALQRAMSYAGAWCIDHSRFAKPATSACTLQTGEPRAR